MAVRNSAKALIVAEGQILLNRCESRFGDYYALPGGGQREGETLLEAVRREVLEETGTPVDVMRLAAVYERISGERDDGTSHKVYFVFLCSPKAPVQMPTNLDTHQVGTVWMPLADAEKSSLFPRAVRDNLPALTGAGETIFLGSERKE